MQGGRTPAYVSLNLDLQFGTYADNGMPRCREELHRSSEADTVVRRLLGHMAGVMEVAERLVGLCR